MSSRLEARLDTLEIGDGAVFGDWQIWRRARRDDPVLFVVHSKRKIAIELSESSSGCLSYFDENGIAWIYYGAGRPQKWDSNHVPDGWCAANTAKVLAEQNVQLGNWRFEFPDGLLRITNTCDAYCVLVDRQKSTFVIRADSGDESLHPMGYEGKVASDAKRASPARGEQGDREATPPRRRLSFTSISDSQGASWGAWNLWRGRNRYGTCLQIIHRHTGFLVEISESSGVMALYRDQGGKVWMVSGSGSPQQAYNVSTIVGDPCRDPGADVILGNPLVGDWDCEFLNVRAKLTSRTDWFSLEIDRDNPTFVFRSKSGFETIHPVQEFHWPTEEEIEEQRQLPRTEEEGPSSLAFWDEYDDLPSAALRIQRLGCPAPETMRAIPEAIMERAWESLDGDAWNEDAGFILANVGRGLWDDGDVAGLLVLRRLYQQALRHNLKERPEVMYSLCEKPLKRFFRDAGDAGLSDSQIESNPMTAVEKCYFGEGCDCETYLQASCVLMAYRDAFLSNEDAPECLPGMYALREAYALYYAGQIEAARQAVAWAMPLIDTLDPERDHELSNAAGILLRASAMAAESAGDREGLFDQVHDALRFLPSTGEHRAAAVYQLADEFKRRGEVDQAMRLLSRVLETPGADADTLKMASMELAAIRAELEGNPAKLQIDRSLAQAWGIPVDFAAQLPDAVATMLAGNDLSDDSVRQLITSLPAWIDYQVKRKRPAKAFSALVFLLKSSLSLKDQTDLPMAYEGILAQADSLLLSAGDVEAMEYEQLRPVAVERMATRRQTPTSS